MFEKERSLIIQIYKNQYIFWLGPPLQFDLWINFIFRWALQRSIIAKVNFSSNDYTCFPMEWYRWQAIFNNPVVVYFKAFYKYA